MTRAEPIRTCVGCRRTVPASELLRYVDSASGPIPDPGRRLPGRGAWLHDTAACREAARRRGALPRALRRRR